MNNLIIWLMEEKPDKSRRLRTCLGCGEKQEYLTKEPAPSYVAWYKAHLACRDLYSPTDTSTVSGNFTGKEHLPPVFFPGDRVEVEVDGKWLPGTFQKPDSAWGDMQKVILDGNDQVTTHGKRDVRMLAEIKPPMEDVSAQPVAAVGVSKDAPSYPKEWDGWKVGDGCDVRSTAGSGWYEGIVTRAAPKLKVRKCGGKTEFSPFDIRQVSEAAQIEDAPVEVSPEDAVPAEPECPQCGFVGVYLLPSGLCSTCDSQQPDPEETKPSGPQTAEIWMLSAEEYTPHRKNADGQWRNPEGSFNQAGLEAWNTHRFAVLKAISDGKDVPEKAVTAHQESYLMRQWQHVQDVQAGKPPVWSGHWEIEVPVGPKGEIARVISHADDICLKSDIGVISETGYYHSGEPAAKHIAEFSPLEYATQLAQHQYAVIRLPKYKREKAMFRPEIPKVSPVLDTTDQKEDDARIAAFMERTGCTREAVLSMIEKGQITLRGPAVGTLVTGEKVELLAVEHDAKHVVVCSQSDDPELLAHELNVRRVSLKDVLPLSPGGDPCTFHNEPRPLLKQVNAVPIQHSKRQVSETTSQPKTTRSKKGVAA